ncbi:hypothetical protein [uncultured Erythrobacter sp.]|uniref:hypothetical protein n=1 Tax=uncultured Erythrobacter sp. TaxID=263913 RepID=UPI002624439F|nr:hypothetical protein [uncultured Erythrobacter sp.]
MKIVQGLALAAPLLLLTACEEEAPEPIAAETGGEAAGEVLGGTISDEMIPLEELTSTSPPAERSASESSDGGRAAPQDEPVETIATEPTGPITGGPVRPEPETPEAEPIGDGPASQ